MSSGLASYQSRRGGSPILPKTRQEVIGWIQENRSISLITIEPLAKSSALIWVEFFDAFLDFGQTALTAMPVSFHFNQSVDCEFNTNWPPMSIK
jgi:hypothetical protein